MIRGTASSWLLRLILLLAVAGPGVRAAAAQEEARTFVGNVTTTDGVEARIAVVVGQDGNALAFMAATNSAWNIQNAKWFLGRVTQNRIRAVASDGTELTGTLQGSQMVGTIGNQGWSGVLSTAGRAGVYRARYGDEVHLVLVAPDGAWLGTAWSATSGRLLRTWDSEGAAVDRSGDSLRARPDPQSSYLDLQPVAPGRNPLDQP